MVAFKQVLSEFIASLQQSKKRFLLVLFILALLIGLPLSLIAAQTQQQLQQHAAGFDVVSLPNGARLIFTIHVDNTQPNLPVEFYIALKNGSIRDQDPASHTYTTDANGNITLQVLPQDKLVISPLASKGYKDISPDRMEINVLEGKCGVKTPCIFTAQPITSTEPSCTPRPKCLDAKPSCTIAEPRNGWCPATSPTVAPTCTPRPKCVDEKPQCMIAEPINGWCQSETGTPTPTPTPKVCPALPTTCRYTGNGFCKVTDNEHPQSCSCGEIICTGL